MTLFFNLSLLEKVTKGDHNYLVMALYLLYKGKIIPRNTYDKYKPIKGLHKGSSFLINPGPLFNRTIDTVFKAQYIKLAGRRDYLTYTTRKDASLNISFFPDLNLDAIKVNPLLKISNDNIKFKYEETVWH